MSEKGYLLLVLHTHQPFVRHPEFDYPVEEDWLSEAISECYVPLAEICNGWLRDGIQARLTFSLTPCLCAMLADGLRQQRYCRYLEERIAFLDREITRLKDREELARLARMQQQRFLRCHQIFKDVWRADVIGAFRKLQDCGLISVIASAATHAYLPLWQLQREIVELQIAVGIQSYEKNFARQPLGFWLPECGFYPGLDDLLQAKGIKFFFLDTHGILNGDPKPKYREYAPVLCPSGVAAFGRHRESHVQVWLKDRGYPGDPAYLDRRADISFELDQRYLFSLTHHATTVPTGISYYRGGYGGSREPYDPQWALARCMQHADHFVQQCKLQAESVYAAMGRKPVFVAMFDTEHFGHWWAEGPAWLDLVIRKLACEQDVVRLVTAEEYLQLNPTNQVVTPSMSSWGYQGYSESWLMGRNHWIYPALYKALESCNRMIAMSPSPVGLLRLALSQYLRELLLAQSSDWAFIMHAETTQSYAENRVREHLDNMRNIESQVLRGSLNSEWINSLAGKNNAFADIDLLDLYGRILKNGAE